ncbi:hypothetical protein GQ42DRAFT_159150 [Ramicandelaber brevisporus]|nr:hypothetical protein GQ42DRAFT_159150 [Ramicandelaber brevisporus]
MRTALVAKDTGDLLLQLFDVGGKLSNGSSVPAQPVLRVNAIHDEGPWNRFLHSTYFKVEGIINYILFGASCLFAIYMLVKAFINGTWTRWLKTLLLINAIYFMVVSITCPQRGPLTNAQLTAQFTAWMVCGATTNLTLLKWASFMRVVFKDKPLLYRGLLGVTVTNIMVWTVAMLTMIAGLYVSDLNVGMVGGLLFTIVAPILFVTLSIYTLALAILYKKRLHKMRISSITKALLYRVTYLMTVFFAGWLLISLCALFLGTGLTYNITWFCIGNAVYTVGVFVLFTGILIILDLADRIQDRGSLRSITNPTGPGSGYHGAVSANASQLGDTLRGSALTGSLSRSHPSRLRSASTKINASGNGLGQSRMSVTDNDDILIGDSIQLGNGNTNSSRIHTNENDGYRPHSVPHRINSPPSMTPLLGEKMHYNVESLSSYNHEYPPSHSPGLPQHLHQQQHSQHSQQTRVHNDQFDDLLSPTYSSDPRQFATPGQVTLVPLDSTDHNYGSGVRFDPLGQRY